MAPAGRTSSGKCGQVAGKTSWYFIMLRRCNDVFMRATIDLPEDLHKRALAIARDTARTLSETVADLMRRGLEHGRGAGSTEEDSPPSTKA